MAKRKRNAQRVVSKAAAGVKVSHEYLRMNRVTDELEVVERHELTPAEAAAWQKQLRQEGYKDATFRPAK
jgi:hypothetical protein